MKQFPQYIMPDGESGIFYNRICLRYAGQAAEEVAGLLRRFTGAKTAIHKLAAETPRFTL